MSQICPVKILILSWSIQWLFENVDPVSDNSRNNSPFSLLNTRIPAEDLDFEIGHFRNIRTSVTLTLDRVTRYTVVYHSSTSIYTPNLVEIGKICGRTLRPALLVDSEEFRVDLIKSRPRILEDTVLHVYMCTCVDEICRLRTDIVEISTNNSVLSNTSLR